MRQEFDAGTEDKLQAMAAPGTSILITGGSGYLGSILTEMLIDRGFSVTVLDNLSYTQNTLFNLFSSGKLKFIYGDVTDQKLMAKVMNEAKYDFIFPLAAVVGFPISEQKPEISWLTNHEAIVNLLKLRKSGQKIIFPNTNSGYGATTGEVYCTEESSLNPISTYGKSKAEAEKAIMASGDAVTFRLATLFGFSPRMRTELMVNNFVWKAVNDKGVVLFERSFKRNFLHVRDAARAFMWAMVHWDSMNGQIYNLGHPDYNISKDELAKLVQKQVPDFNIFYAEIGQDPDKRNYVVSTDKIRKTGFEFKYGLEDGVKELLEGYNAFKDFRFKNY